jgi:hypothetical protein
VSGFSPPVTDVVYLAALGPNSGSGRSEKKSEQSYQLREYWGTPHLRDIWIIRIASLDSIGAFVQKRILDERRQNDLQ